MAHTKRYDATNGKEHAPSKEEPIVEIQRHVAYLLSTDDYAVEEKEAVARRFFQA
jgi:hypothetical protein